jgi:hypothetical protein
MAKARPTPVDAAIAELTEAFDAYLRQLDRADVGVSVMECDTGIHVDLCSRGFCMISHLIPSGGVIGHISRADALYFVHDCLLLMDQQILAINPPRKVNRKRVRGRVDARLAEIVASQHEGDLS